MNNKFIPLEEEIDSHAFAFNENIKKFNYSEALKIEYFVMSNLLKSQENPENFERWDALTNTSKNIAINYCRLSLIRPTNNKKITFIIPNPSFLAHEEALKTLLISLKKYNNSFSFSIVYMFGKKNETNIHKVFYANLVNEFFFLENKSLDVEKQRLQFLNLKSKFLDCLYIVITSPSLLFHTLLITSNEKIGFLALKHYPKRLNFVDKWIMTGENGSLITENGNTWNCFSLPRIQIFKKNNFNPQANYFGSISRIEKLRSVNFLECVSKVLDLSLSSRFVFTTKNENDHFILNFFHNKGQVHLIKNLGYIDYKNKFFWNSIKVYLEPFPFGGGLMLYEAIKRSIPVVYRTDSAFKQINICNNYIKHSFGELYPDFSSICCANNDLDYINKSLDFLKNNNIEKYKSILKIYSRNYFFDEAKYCNDLASIFLS